MKNQIKNKVVTFRLSEIEFDFLKSACGADKNSVSAVARRTLLEWAESQAPQPKVHQRLADIDARLHHLCTLLGGKH